MVEPTSGVVDKGLAAGKLTVLGSTVIGLASTAPLYSLAATIGFVVLAVGAQAQIAFILAFIPMMFTAYAYKELNNAVPDCGTAFTWAAKAFGPRTGWMAGWGVAVAGVVVMANLAEISSQYIWLLVGDGSLAENKFLVTALGVALIAVMTWVTCRGVQVGEKMQNFLLLIQYLALAAFVAGALLNYFNGTAPDPTPPSLDWFNPFAFQSFEGFIQAILLALFIYWGWDTCLALNEETRNPRTTPGLAALLSTVILLVTYVSVTVVAMMYAGIGDTGTGLANPDHSDDVFYMLGRRAGPIRLVLIRGRGLGALVDPDTILPTSRGTLPWRSSGPPDRFAEVHRYTKPLLSTAAVGVVSILFYVGMGLISNDLLADRFLHGVGDRLLLCHHRLRCVVYFRDSLFDSPRNFFFRFLFLLGPLATVAFTASAIDMFAPDYGSSSFAGVGGTFIIGIGSRPGLVSCMRGRSPRAKEFFEKKT
jgi:amino acid transporter